MIEFKGYLTGTSQKFFCKQIIKLQQKIILFTLIPIFVILIIVFYLMFDVIALYPEVIISEIILSALALLLPNIQTKKEKEKITQQKVCQAIIDYNKNHPDDSGWNRDIDTMLVEWDWHNGFYNWHIKRSSSQSVNFDMGLGTTSTSKPIQIGGYFIEYVDSKIEDFGNNARDFCQRGL